MGGKKSGRIKPGEEQRPSHKKLCNPRKGVYTLFLVNEMTLNNIK